MIISRKGECETKTTPSFDQDTLRLLKTSAKALMFPFWFCLG